VCILLWAPRRQRCKLCIQAVASKVVLQQASLQLVAEQMHRFAKAQVQLAPSGIPEGEAGAVAEDGPALRHAWRQHPPHCAGKLHVERAGTGSRASRQGSAQNRAYNIRQLQASLPGWCISRSKIRKAAQPRWTWGPAATYSEGGARVRQVGYEARVGGGSQQVGPAQ
jgi:hypothetical protein